MFYRAVLQFLFYYAISRPLLCFFLPVALTANLSVRTSCSVSTSIFVSTRGRYTYLGWNCTNSSLNLLSFSLEITSLFTYQALSQPFTVAATSQQLNLQYSLRVTLVAALAILLVIKFSIFLTLYIGQNGLRTVSLAFFYNSARRFSAIFLAFTTLPAFSY